MFSPKARNQPQPAKPARYSCSWRHSPLQGSLLKQTRCDCLSQPIIGLLPPHVHGMLLVMKVLNAPQGPHMGLAIKPSPVSLSVPVVRAVTCCLFPFRSCRAPLSSLCVQKHHPSPLSSRRRYAMHPRCLHVAAVCRRSSLLFSSVVASFLPPSLPGLLATTAFWGPGVLSAHWGPSCCLRLSCGGGRVPGLGGNCSEFLCVKAVRQHRASALENFLPHTKRLKWVKTLPTVPCCQQLQVKCCFCSAYWKDCYVPKLGVSRSTHLQCSGQEEKKKIYSDVCRQYIYILGKSPYNSQWERDFFINKLLQKNRL